MTTIPSQPQPFRCTRCGAQVAVVDATRGLIDHGPAVLDSDGVARPDPTARPDYPQNTAVLAHTTRAVCDACGHSWHLRRRFDPTTPAALAAGADQIGAVR